MSLGAPEILVLILIVLLLFGTTRLPKLARSLREARDEFHKGSDEGSKAAPPATPPPANQPPTPAPPVDNPPSTEG